jgi:hypothetical protein
MLVSAIVISAVLIAIWFASRNRIRPLDRKEVLVVRNHADRVRREQSQPFEW